MAGRAVCVGGVLAHLCLALAKNASTCASDKCPPTVPEGTSATICVVMTSSIAAATRATSAVHGLRGAIDRHKVSPLGRHDPSMASSQRSRASSAIYSFGILCMAVATVRADCRTGVVSGTFNAPGLGAGGSTAYVARSGGTSGDGKVQMHGNGFSIKHDPRVYLASGCVKSFSPSTFLKLPPLVGRTLSVRALSATLSAPHGSRCALLEYYAMMK